jgi:hypothetical protein
VGYERIELDNEPGEQIHVPWAGRDAPGNARPRTPAHAVGLGPNRESNPEQRSSLWTWLDGNTPTMRLDELLDRGKAETKTRL